MKEIQGNLWSYFNDKHIICVTTNGFVKHNGEAVMGRGCALEATTMIPGVAKTLGDRITKLGNVIAELHDNPKVISFPVKHMWWEKADLTLISKSALDLLSFMIYEGTNRPIILPRPGCGNGQLLWQDVRPLLEFLPNNVWVITK